MIAVIAQGGGLGHLTRVRAALHTLGAEGPVAVITASPFARDERMTGEWDVVEVPLELAREPARLGAWTASVLRYLSPDHLVVDAFPFGLMGELAPARLPDVPVVHLARRLRWQQYCAEPQEVRFAETFVLEPLEREHLRFLQSSSQRVATLTLVDPLATTDVDLQSLGEQPVWLVVHTGGVEEVREVVGYARDLAQCDEVTPRFVVVTRCRDIDLGSDVTVLDALPSWPLFAQAEMVVSAAGFNVMRQTASLRAEGRHRFVPMPRRYDDQYWRAAAARAEQVRGAGSRVPTCRSISVLSSTPHTRPSSLRSASAASSAT